MDPDLYAATVSARDDLARYGFELAELPRVAHSNMWFLKTVTGDSAEAYYNRVTDRVYVNSRFDRYGDEWQQAILGHELIHKCYSDDADTFRDIIVQTHHPEVNAVEEATATFYDLLKTEGLDSDIRRERALTGVSKDYSFGDHAADHLETAYTVYDSFGDDPEADTHTFRYLQELYERTFADATIREVVDRFSS